VNEWLDEDRREALKKNKKKPTRVRNRRSGLADAESAVGGFQPTKRQVAVETSNSPSTRRTTRRAAIVPRSRSGSSRVSHAAHDARGRATRADGARAG
jgi:hypothetical protein